MPGTASSDSDQPQRLYAKTFLQMVRNSVGTAMFRSFYVRTAERGEFDALGDGDNSCAFYVSSLLVIFKQIYSVHGLVDSLITDLQASGWQLIDYSDETNLRPGDVIVWEAADFADGRFEHIGFYIGGQRAVSTSMTKKVVAEHDMHFGDAQRGIKQVFRAKPE